MHIVPEDANDIPVRVCLGFSRVVSGGRSKNPGNPRLFEHRSRPRVPCDRKLGYGHSAFRIEAGAAKILIDPYLYDNSRDKGWIGCCAGEDSTQAGGR